MEFKNVLVIGALGNLLRVMELKAVPEAKAMEYAIARCQKEGLAFKVCYPCDAVSYDVIAEQAAGRLRGDDQHTRYLPPGARVRIEQVDMYGYNGRDRHPERTDAGREAVIITADARVSDGEKQGDRVPAVPGLIIPDEVDCCYEAQLLDGKLLQLMAHEIVVVE